MKKVRPMIDKDLREYVLSKFNHEFTFNESLRMLLGNHEVSNERFLALLENSEELKQEVGRLHNEKAELKYLHTERSKEAAALNEKIAMMKSEKVGLNASIKEAEDNCARLFNQTAPLNETIGKLLVGFGVGLFVGLFIL